MDQDKAQFNGDGSMENCHKSTLTASENVLRAAPKPVDNLKSTDSPNPHNKPKKRRAGKKVQRRRGRELRQPQRRSIAAKPLAAVQDAVKHKTEVRRTEHKGLGLFAKEDIPKGARVLAERPLLSIDPNLEVDGQNVLARFRALPAEKQREYLSLYSPVVSSDDATHIWSIFATNAFGLERSDGSVAPAICSKAARLNHSCVPNVFCAYNEELDLHTVHAVRDIAAEEELLVSYIPGSYLVRQQRQEELLDRYRFMCVCPSCEVPQEGDDHSEHRHLRMQQLDTELKSIRNNLEITGPEGMQAAAERLDELVGIMEGEEGVLAELALA